MSATLKLHRIHAAPAAGKGGCSFDLGGIRWRGDGGAPTPEGQERKRAMAYRLAVCWNVIEGIPTEDLEAGILRDVFDAAERLVAIMGGDGAEPGSDVAALRDALARFDGRVDRTDGRLHDCKGCDPTIDGLMEPDGEPDGR